MVKPVAIHREAQLEFLDSIAFYEDRKAGLGRQFELAVRTLVLSLPANPERHPQQGHGTRRALVKRFPYVIRFMDLPEIIWVVAISHTRRKPGYWHHRLYD